MSDFHVLDKAVNGKTCRAAIHLAIPDENNLAGVNYRTAIVERFGEITSVVPNHVTEFPSDDAALKSGAQYETVIMKRFTSRNLTNNQRRQQIRVEVIQMKIDIQTEGSDLYDEIIEPLKWWGYHEDV